MINDDQTILGIYTRAVYRHGSRCSRCNEKFTANEEIIIFSYISPMHIKCAEELTLYDVLDYIDGANYTIVNTRHMEQLRKGLNKKSAKK